jgi:LPXTG-site transpeptidase (sortase) family protein
MKLLGLNKNIYTVIIIFTILASLIQLNFLGSGILSRFYAAEQNAKIPVQQVAGVAAQQKTEEFTPLKIEIAKVGISLPVVSVPLENGTWQVYPHVANFAQSTSLVNKKSGNVGIYGHDREDAFHKIKDLLTGDDIIVIGKNSRAIYKVQSASIIVPTAVDVFNPTKEPVLTLITCNGIFSDKRYMVRAKLIKIENIK